MSRLLLSLLVLGICSTGPIDAQTIFSAPRSGSLTYHGWEFSWNVGSNKEGLELYNVRYKSVKVLHKASMPVVRVKYRGKAESVTSGCGPYQDRLKWSNMVVPSGANSKVVVRYFTGKMELAVYSKIGGYHLYQAWYFHQDGRMQPVLYSSRWSCSHNPKNRRDHRHHPYWRLDFDIEVPGDNQIHEFRRASGSPSHVSTLYALERNAFKASTDADLFWTVGRAATGRHVVVRYSTNELRDASGSPWFSYSNKDMGARRYRWSEDSGWPFGALGHLGFRSPVENINRQDVVFWTVGHMTHIWTQADHANPQWHASGPVIRAMW